MQTIILQRKEKKRKKKKMYSFCGSWWWWGWRWHFPRVRGFWETVEQLIPRLRFFFFFFWVEINSCTLIPLCTPGSVHSGWASWDDCDRVFPASSLRNQKNHRSQNSSGRSFGTAKETDYAPPSPSPPTLIFFFLKSYITLTPSVQKEDQKPQKIRTERPLMERSDTACFFFFQKRLILFVAKL